MSGRVDHIASHLLTPQFFKWLHTARTSLSLPTDKASLKDDFDTEGLAPTEAAPVDHDHLTSSSLTRFSDFAERASLYDKCLAKCKTLLFSPYDVVLPNELADELTTCYLALPKESAKEAVEVALARVRRLVGDHRRHRRSTELSVLRNETVPHLMPKWKPAEQALLVAADEALGIRVRYGGFVNTYVNTFGSSSYGAELRLVADGVATSAAWSLIEKDLRLTLPCIFESLLGGAIVLRHTGNALGGWTLGRRTVKASADFDGPSRFFADSQSIIRQCVELILSPRLTDRKDDLLWRVRRAVVMLSHARKQDNASVSLALSFAAIEALFSFDKELVSDRLSSNLVAFLVPEGSERLEFKRLIKKIYDKRSQYVHGLNDETTSERLAGDMLNFVGATLRAVLEWREFRIRMSDTASVDDLRESCDQSWATAQQVVGAPDWYWMFIPRSVS